MHIGENKKTKRAAIPREMPQKNCTKSRIPFVGSEEHIAKANGIEIWYETFGEKENPSLLLIMGARGQGILWPTELCEQLAKENFYVIRYDHRDTGYSTCFDYEKNPYDLLDMAKDGIGLLDYLGIDKAHLWGLSMGGPIAELMAVHSPQRVFTITLMATSCDFRPASLAFDDMYPQDIVLSRPKEVYLNLTQRFFQSQSRTEEEILEERVLRWSILNGSEVPLKRSATARFIKNSYSEISIQKV